jgi:hypothetical protein
MADTDKTNAFKTLVQEAVAEALKAHDAEAAKTTKTRTDATPPADKDKDKTTGFLDSLFG